MSAIILNEKKIYIKNNICMLDKGSDILKKMPTLFVREFEDHQVKRVLNEVHPDCLWVLNNEGYATEKLDGTCCMIKDNQIYKRFDFKKGRILPKNAIPCQEEEDPITGHFPHWVLCDPNNPNDIYHLEAFKKLENYADGTYELIGKHINGNAYNLDYDILECHGLRILNDVPRDYEGIKNYLEDHYIEGIVFYRGNGEMCKIKRSDFGFFWKIPKR